MKIAVTYENGMISTPFGPTQQCHSSEGADTPGVLAESGTTNGSGHGALAGFLAQHGVDTLICGDHGCGHHSCH